MQLGGLAAELLSLLLRAVLPYSPFFKGQRVDYRRTLTRDIVMADRRMINNVQQTLVVI
jgi:hypothetical protein